MPDRDYGDLLTSLKEVCTEMFWIGEAEFLNKCIQLYDTIMVRHGLMVVGEANAGKSIVIDCLKRAMTRLKGKGSFVFTFFY